MSIFLQHKQDRQHLQALHDCRMQEKLLEVFALALADATSALIKADDMAHMYRLQGRAKALEDFLEAVEKAGEVMK